MKCFIQIFSGRKRFSRLFSSFVLFSFCFVLLSSAKLVLSRYFDMRQIEMENEGKLYHQMGGTNKEL